MEITKAPLCGHYSVLSEKETKELCKNTLFCNRLNLPRVYITDPQIIWIGAEIGQVIKIKCYSLISGYKIYYRIVYPKKDW